jgi:hypothetical protein
MGLLTEENLKAFGEACERNHRNRVAAEAAAPEVVAIKITYDIPQPDGIFEILFLTRVKADDYKGRANVFGSVEEIGFAEGVELARQPDCSGGSFALAEAQRFQKINKFVQGLRLDLR